MPPPPPRRTALLVTGPPFKLRVVDQDLDRMADGLRAKGFAEPVICRQATRTQLLAHLDALVGDAGPDDCVVFYYVGHGARALFSGGLHPGYEAGRVWPYLLTASEDEGEDEGNRFSGLLAVELSERICALTQRTPNVTTVIDCCFAHAMVRGAEQVGQLREFPRPDILRVRETVARLYAQPPLPISHPLTVRLSATMSEMRAYENFEAGHFTRLLVSSLAEVDGDSLPWAGHISRVREQLAPERKSESQWPELLGPSNRLPFQLRVYDVSDHVGYVGAHGDRHGWLRAGTLHGLTDGATIEFPRKDEDAVVGRVDGIHPYYAKLAFDTAARPTVGALGYVRDGFARHGVAVHGQGALADELRRRLSAHRRLTLDAQAALSLRVGAELELDDPGRDLCLRRPPDRVDDMLIDIDAIARAQALIDALHEPRDQHQRMYDECDWVWRYVRYDSMNQHDVLSGDTLHIDDLVGLTFQNTTNKQFPNLYFNLFDLGVEGAFTRLTYGHPSGLELSKKNPRAELFTDNSEGPVPICWADEQVPRDRKRKATLYLIVSTRPLDLSTALARPPTPRPFERARADVEPAELRWDYETLDVWIDPHPRSRL